MLQEAQCRQLRECQIQQQNLQSVHIKTATTVTSCHQNKKITSNFTSQIAFGLFLMSVCSEVDFHCEVSSVCFPAGRS